MSPASASLGTLPAPRPSWRERLQAPRLQWTVRGVLTALLALLASADLSANGADLYTTLSLLSVPAPVLCRRFPWAVTCVLMAVTIPLVANSFFTAALLADIITLPLLIVDGRVRQAGLLFLCFPIGWLAALLLGHPLTDVPLVEVFLLASGANIGFVLRYSREMVAREARLREAALGAQRTAIARDLHDTLARANTQMVMRVQAVRPLAAGEPRVAAILDEIAAMGHRSVSDLRTMLRLLRQDTPTPTAPTPSLTQAMTNARTTLANAGLHATITTDGELTHLPPTITTTLARALDEAVANMTKYAAKDAHCTIIIGATPTQATLLATNPIADHHRPTDPALTSGLGLIGLHERATALDGTLTHTTTDHHWTLTLTLPLTLETSHAPLSH
ncbi:hypothetical protein ADENT20671_1860 [Actinomyces denticolens]|uniref:sensor histidine kinase n=1 Tax=Actinomyces denticolens TaxID=52767 RepID=UPI00098203D0|nr:histidine kinase [Actinomyces denticolens]GAV95082.1 hypothetical protein ADENT20671_1860 [Actinomyces denticolens]